MKTYKSPIIRFVFIDDRDLVCSSPATKNVTFGGKFSGQGAAEGRSRDWDDEEDW